MKLLVVGGMILVMGIFALTFFSDLVTLQDFDLSSISNQYGHMRHNKTIIDHDNPPLDQCADAVEYIETLARQGGDHWLNLETDTILQENSQVLAKIVVNSTIEHVLRLNPLSVDFATYPPIQVNCSNPNYANVLTGRKDLKTKFIVDSVPFGFDVDLLEIRLLELSDLVDVFVISEQSKTYKGIPKPVPLVPKLLKGRLKCFRDKVDYYFEDVSYIRLHSQWEIESTSRSSAMKYIMQKYGNSTWTEVYVVQNGDEIIERTAMAHFKECELKPPTGIHDRLFFPSISFKRNVAWVVETYDMKEIQLVSVQQNISDIRNYLWRLGPTIQHISVSQKLTENIRGISYSPTDYHMGLGSANHFSNPSDPKLTVVKMFSTVDSAPYFQSESFWKKAQMGNLTCDDIRRFLFICKTDGNSYQWLHIDSLGLAK